MTLITTSLSTTADFDHAYSLSDGESVTVGSGLTISAGGAGAAALHASGAGSVTLGSDVMVVSGLFDGISFGGAGRATINAGSTVSAHGFGILFAGSGNSLQNFGSIAGGTAVRANGPTQIFNEGALTGLNGHGLQIEGSGVSLFNFGSIGGSQAAILVGAAAGVAAITNNGTITGGSQGAIRVAGATAVMFGNHGHVIGDVSFGDGSDIYDGRGGFVSGSVLLGGGDDRGYGGEALEIFEGGSGEDTIDGGGGNDTALYSGSRADYVVSAANGVTTIADKRADADGTDTLTNVRFARFLGDNSISVLANAAPDGVKLSVSAVSETALVNTAVASVSAHDGDGDTLTFTLSDPSGAFRLDGSSLVLARALDYETGPRHYGLTVTARDAFGGSTTQALSVTVGNEVEFNPLTLIGTALADGLTGEAGADVIKGLAGNDTLKGEAGNDRIHGGLGNDMLSGGLGKDVFVFDAKLAKTNALNRKQNLDKVLDFKVVDDTLQLAKGVFSKIAKKGVLAKGAFHIGTKAHDADDRIVYNNKSGALFYDADGIGTRQAIQIATLSKNLKMTEKDFFIV